MGLSETTIEADILVIGGGSAGTMAAIRALELDPTRKVVVFDKSDVLYSGCVSRGMDALNVVAVPGVGTPEEYLEVAHQGLEEIVDDSLVYAWVSRTWPLVEKLEKWGMYFPKDNKGNYEILDVPPKGKYCLAIKEPDIKVKLARRMQQAGAVIYNRTMAIELLQTDDRVTGAIGLNIRTGSLIICQAKAVIICCGGTARFGETTNGHPYVTFDFPGNTGEAYAMAFKVGAKLTGFEYTIVDYPTKDISAAGLHITMTRGAELVDALDQPFTENRLSIADMVMAHQSGRGPLRVKMQHLPEEKIAEIEDILFTTERPIQKRFFEGRKIDFRKNDIEHWPIECCLCGGHGITGILVNGKAETSVEGLYAAGDAANVRGFLPGALVMGEVAAENAMEYIDKITLISRRNEKTGKTIKKLARISELRGPVSVQEFEMKVRRMITHYITTPKNGYKLKRALEWMDQLQADCYEVIGLRDTADVYKFLEMESIITSARLSATASNERKESRWSSYHFRTDYPERDDSQWKKHIILQKGKDDMEIKVTTRPVERIKI